MFKERWSDFCCGCYSKKQKILFSWKQNVLHCSTEEWSLLWLLFAIESDETAESCKQLWKHSYQTKPAGSVLKTVGEPRWSLRLGNKESCLDTQDPLSSPIHFSCWHTWKHTYHFSYCQFSYLTHFKHIVVSKSREINPKILNSLCWANIIF